MSFLKAKWTNLIMANYSIAPEALEPYLPAHTQLDLWNDHCFVSLVGFLFENTSMFGLPVPFHQRFEEINLRFYVKCNTGGVVKRGTVFISELVPKPMVTFIANSLYDEHYQTTRMDHQFTLSKQMLSVQYRCYINAYWHTLSVSARDAASPMVAGSVEEFLTEHYWGYTRISEHKTASYEVRHPRWRCHEILSHEINVDFQALYGAQFAFINTLKPHSVLLAEGSAVSVEHRNLVGV